MPRIFDNISQQLLTAWDSRHATSTSSRLQTSTDWFYPDFVCQLKDGRILAVEYKGKDRFDSADSEEKRAVGAVWASRSGGRCLFAMPTDRDFSTITNLGEENMMADIKYRMGLNGGEADADE